MRSLLFWDVTQRRLVIIYRRFGTTYLSRLQGSSSSARPLKIRPIRCPETSVNNYQSTLRNIPEERSQGYYFTFFSPTWLYHLIVDQFSVIYNVAYAHGGQYKSRFRWVWFHSPTRIKEKELGSTNTFLLSAAAENSLPYSIQVALVLRWGQGNRMLSRPLNSWSWY